MLFVIGMLAIIFLALVGFIYDIMDVIAFFIPLVPISMLVYVALT